MKSCMIILILMIGYLFSGCTQTLWVQKDFDAIKQTIDTVSIIFPQIEYSEKHGEVKKTKSGHSLFVSRHVADALKELIDNGKFVSTSADIIFDSTVVTKWMRNHFADSKPLYTRTYDSLKGSSGETRTIPIIPELQELIDKVHTRYFILVTGYSYGTTETTKRFELMQEQTFDRLYGQTQAYKTDWFGMSLQIILVDAQSNEVLWYNYNKEQKSRYDPLNKDEVKELCLELLTAK